MAERQGYRFRNQDREWLFDLHLNGGTYNLGHRNPELVETLKQSADYLDVGNHHFASELRAQLAERLLGTQNFGARYVALTTSGSEAVDLAIKAARWATGRRTVVAIDSAYHGRSGFSGAAGDATSATYFHSDDPTRFKTFRYNDLSDLSARLREEQPACVLLEVIPATAGFPAPDPEFMLDLRTACDDVGALLIADEVQTGLGRSGAWWAIERFGVKPDMLITSKGLGGGLYPIAATLMTERVGRWLEENGWAHVSTFGGAELGCAIALKALEITGRPETWRAIEHAIERFRVGLEDIAARNSFLFEVRQTGLIIGLRFDHPQGGPLATTGLLKHGVWAIFAGFDPSVLQFKPGLLLTDPAIDEILIEPRKGCTKLSAGQPRQTPVPTSP